MREELFRGTWALICAKRRSVTKLPVLLGFLPAAFIGFFANLAGGADAEGLQVVLGLVLGGAAFVAPLVAAADSTLFASVSGGTQQCRREEFLALSMGRLALPSAISIVAGACLLAFGLSLLLGAGVTLGFSTVWEALVEAPKDPWLLPLGCVAAFVYSNALSTLGTTSALGVLLLPLPFVVFVICAPAMGHSEEAARSFGVMHGVVLGIYYLLLPFILYARQRHHWTTTKKGISPKASVDVRVLVAGLASVTALGILGVGWTLAGVLLAGGFAVWLGGRKLPPVERPHRSSLQVAMLVALILLAPPGLYALVYDAQLVAAVAPTPTAEVSRLSVAPGERYVAAQLTSNAKKLNGQAVKRVAVVDLQGERAPLLLEPRFARIYGWSKDGRYLAVGDYGLGRLGVGVPNLDFQTHWAALRSDLGRSVFSTLVYDTETQDVTRYGACAVPAGWATPDDLIEIEATLGGDYALTRAQSGASSVFPRGDGRLRVESMYAQGQVLIRHGGQRFAWGPEGVVPLGREPDPAPVTPTRTLKPIGGWTATLGDEDPQRPGAPSRALRLTRGDQEVTIENVYSAFGLPSQANRAFVLDKAGLSRVELDGGERTLLVPATATLHRLWIRSGRSEVPYRWVWNGEWWFKLDTATGDVAKTDWDGNFGKPRLLGSGQVMTIAPDGTAWLYEPSGTKRSLFAGPTTAAK